MIAQIGRFGVVGLCAMMVHAAVVFAFVPLGLHPLIANIAAFFVAFFVSYTGHRYFTFSGATHGGTLLRFFGVAVSSFIVNEFLYFLLLNYLHIDYQIALVIVLVAVSAMTFVLSRSWAFRVV